jgi:hypothetical protein
MQMNLRGLAYTLPIVQLLASSRPAIAPPPLMLWAWERPGDLRDLPQSAGVAFLAASIYLRDGGAHALPRFQPLRLAPGTYRMAVIRFEVPAVPQALSTEQRHIAVRAILDTVRVTHPNALQLDFDARTSERAFYAAVIRELRTKLDPGLFLSMTALVSWCDSPSWLERLPVDEVVPMVFEMGSSTAATETLFRSGSTFQNPLCRHSLGISLREVPPRAPSQRTYVFAYDDWSMPLTRSVVSQFQ